MKSKLNELNKNALCAVVYTFKIGKKARLNAGNKEKTAKCTKCTKCSSELGKRLA